MTRFLAALLALALLVPATAAAQGPATNAPPGNSAIDEYLETVPGASGNSTPRTPAAGTNGSAGSTGPLTAAQRDRFERLGADGKTLAKVVESTSPEKKKQEPPTTLRDLTSRSPLGEVLGVAEGNGGGMGLLLPAILIASLLAAIGLVLLRRRSTS